MGGDVKGLGKNLIRLMAVLMMCGSCCCSAIVAIVGGVVKLGLWPCGGEVGPLGVMAVWWCSRTSRVNLLGTSCCN